MRSNLLSVDIVCIDGYVPPRLVFKRQYFTIHLREYSFSSITYKQTRKTGATHRP